MVVSENYIILKAYCQVLKRTYSLLTMGWLFDILLSIRKKGNKINEYD